MRACCFTAVVRDGSSSRASARRGRGLPARVIPLEVFHVASLGLDLMLGSIALGAAQFVILAAGSESPGYLRALEAQMGHAQEIVSGLGLGEGRFRLIEARDVATLEKAVWTAATAARARCGDIQPVQRQARHARLHFRSSAQAGSGSQGGGCARGGRSLRRGRRRPAEMHHVPRLRGRLSGGCPARHEGQAPVEVHRA